MKGKKLQERGVLLSVISSFFGSISIVFVVAAAKLLNPLLVAGAGALIAALFLFFMVKFSKKRKLSWKIIKKNKRDLFEQAFIRTFLGHALLLWGFSLTHAIKAVFFTKIEPFFVLLWGYSMGKEKLNMKHIFIIIVHITGILLLSTGGVFDVFTTSQLGDFLAISGIVLLAYTYYSGARLAKKIGARATITVSNTFGGSMNLGLAFLIFPLYTFTNAEGWMYLMGYVIFFQLIALTLWYAALKTARGWVVSAVRALGPVAGALFAFVLFAETLTELQLIGAGVILVTSALIAKEK